MGTIYRFFGRIIKENTDEPKWLPTGAWGVPEDGMSVINEGEFGLPSISPAIADKEDEESKETSILLVRLNGDLESQLESLLRDNYKVDAAQTNKEAFSRLKKGDYDLIIVSPDCDGYMLANIATSVLSIPGERIVMYGPSAHQSQAGVARVARSNSMLKAILNDVMKN